MNPPKQQRTAAGFSHQEKLYFAGCDAYGNARVGTIISLLAEISGHDFDNQGLTYEKLYEQRQIFLLSRMSMKIHKYPGLNDVVTVSTWENGAEGLFLRRNYELEVDGTLYVSCKSEWLLTNPETRKILRPSEFTGKELTLCPKELDCPPCKKIAYSREDLLPLGARRIVYSDLDYNGHLYSGNYGNIVWDFLPVELRAKPLREFFISFSKEAVLNETLDLSGFQNEGGYIMEGRNKDALCFSCECRF